MGKIYIDTVKYMVHADFEIKGLVEKPDVVGAIFGQTEGLLGDELDLREMQKSGRIGRIEVELETKDGKSYGKILLPSSLDMVETSVIAAAIESVDRVGPCEANISVKKIEDMRNVKRKTLVDRAKVLLKSLVTETLPESKEILELVRDEVKASGVVEYGPEKVTGGPDIETFDSIIVVEGRADVINLLKNDIKNVVALGGASVPKYIIDLSKRKELTLFLDGDRGGDIILREVLDAGDVDFVARAPPGREVEELSRKEIIKALRAKVPVEQAESQYYNKRRPQQDDFRKRREGGYEQKYREEQGRRPQRFEQRLEPKPGPALMQPQPAAYAEVEPEQERAGPAPRAEPEQAPAREPVVQPRESVPEELKSHLSELNGTLKARLIGSGGELIKELPVRDLITELNSTQANPVSVVLDGIITQRLVDLAASKGVSRIAGIKEGNIAKRPEGLRIYTSQ
ncbi:MAG: DNA primase DnaG [Candidatus Micrarchaeota archaeon]|nr:DNA primase DnaG [Candidatus Micrarchaeota archaeon]